MTKWLTIILLCLIIGGGFLGVKAVHAISGSNLEVESINANFSQKTASIRFNVGQYETSNRVLTNGDTLSTTSFVPSGETTSTQLSGASFTQVFSGLIGQGALNMDAVTNATIGVTGVAIAGTDTTTVDIPANNSQANDQTNSD